MSIETRLRQTGGFASGGGGSSNSGGLAGTGIFYVLSSANGTLPNAYVTSAGANVTFTFTGTNMVIAAITSSASNSGGLASTGGLYVVYSSNPILPFSRVSSANFPLQVLTDTTFLYTQVNTSFIVTSNRLINSTFPLAGGGNLGADLTLTVNTSFLVTSNRLINTTSPLGGGGNLGTDLTLIANTSFLINTNMTIASTAAFYLVTSGNVTLTPNAVVYSSALIGFRDLPVQSAKLYASTSAARIDAGTAVWRLLYSATTQQFGIWQFILPRDYSGSPFVRILHSNDSSLSVAKTTSWIVDQWGFSPGNALAIYNDTFGGTNTSSIALSAGYSAGLLQTVTVPLATVVSMNVGNLIRLRVSGSNGAAGNTELLGLNFEYTRV